MADWVKVPERTTTDAETIAIVEEQLAWHAQFGGVARLAAGFVGMWEYALRTRGQHNADSLEAARRWMARCSAEERAAIEARIAGLEAELAAAAA